MCVHKYIHPISADEKRGTKDEIFSCQAPPDMTIGELRVAFRDWMGRVQGFGLPPPPDPEGGAKEGEGDAAAAAGVSTGDTKVDKKAAKEAAKEAKKKKKEAAKEEKSKKSGKKEKKTKELKPPTPMNFTSGRLVHYGCTIKACQTLSTTYPNYLV